jgi:hypothetical protein
VIALLDALARAAIAPTSLRVVHELAYLSNVLAPVFELSPMSASLLKRRGGPYYPELQQTIDRLVGCGMIAVSDLRYVLVPEESRYRLHGCYHLNRALADPVVNRYREVYAVTGEPLFIDELAVAYSTLASEQLGYVVGQDARYADDDVDSNNVIDFGEWTSAAKANFSRNAALTFAPTANLMPAERLYLYLDHLRRRASGGD